jgi:hypothetical protein
MILKEGLLSSIDDIVTIFWTHCTNVKNYHNLMLQKLFASNEIFNVLLDINAY